MRVTQVRHLQKPRRLIGPRLVKGWLQKSRQQETQRGHLDPAPHGRCESPEEGHRRHEGKNAEWGEILDQLSPVQLRELAQSFAERLWRRRAGSLRRFLQELGRGGAHHPPDGFQKLIGKFSRVLAAGSGLE